MVTGCSIGKLDALSVKLITFFTFSTISVIYNRPFMSYPGWLWMLSTLLLPTTTVYCWLSTRKFGCSVHQPIKHTKVGTCANRFSVYIVRVI